jgi:hypothetical protein
MHSERTAQGHKADVEHKKTSKKKGSLSKKLEKKIKEIETHIVYTNESCQVTHKILNLGLD